MKQRGLHNVTHYMSHSFRWIHRSFQPAASWNITDSMIRVMTVCGLLRQLVIGFVFFGVGRSMCLYNERHGTARHVTPHHTTSHHGRSCFDVGTVSHDYITSVWRRRKEQSIAPVWKNEILIAPPVVCLFSMASPARSNVRRRMQRFDRSCVNAAKKIGGTRASEILRYVQSGSREETPLSTDIFAL